MKRYSPFIKVIFASACLLMGALFSFASAASTNTTPRIWVQYKVGRKAAVREALTQMGAIFNYDFGDLNAFVVSLPEDAISEIARHPDVSDYWYAQASSKAAPRQNVEQP